jgi:Ferredoxin
MSTSDTAPRKPRGTVSIDAASCKGCGFCIEFCPRHALGFGRGFNVKGYHTPTLVHPEACIGCNLCGLYCPDFAIFGHPLEQQADSAAGEGEDADSAVPRSEMDGRSSP